jgi:hypothetical protein
VGDTLRHWPLTVLLLIDCVWGLSQAPRDAMFLQSGLLVQPPHAMFQRPMQPQAQEHSDIHCCI